MKSIEILKSDIRDKVNNKEEKILLFKILDNIEKSINNDEVVCTNFLNLAQLDLVKRYINYEYMCIAGGNEYNERNLIILSNKDIDNFNDVIRKYISYIEVEYSKYDRNVKISHRDVLGSILSLGIERELIGDIYVKDDNAYIIVKKDVTNLLIQNVNKIRNVNVRLKIIEKEDIAINYNVGEEKQILVSSMRLDNILSSALKISRNKINELIEEKKIYINWKNEMKKDKLIRIYDTISIRGIGRIVINDSIGISKKGKAILSINKYM